ncbi:Polysulphide reductase NrfD [Anaeromyxobacter sp. K]|uniref:NrfD/PsrC family molybdoenzyme membrane anchor subunit n=1 Tax=Anaeromyxobacter sp. (strain K) TaxID=447217 RepID=UPI00015F88E0|nr:NrfD/PsrC family molybdoenzyme membrane anchor subunit [Anaeromyxobacter sp. K]ACG72106.1 Polysulphide reductase NrfD [Anaeromyxobacter sp. K]
MMGTRTDPARESARPRDGRNVDPRLGELLGEGSGQQVRELEGAATGHDRPAERAWGEPPAEALAAPEGPSYYGQPVLKEPVWRWEIPAYFFVGGLAGASAVLGAAASIAGGEGTAALVRRCRLVAAGGAAASAVLLVRDLGRPSRFLNMLRVFRPTSPMNMGTWVLTGFGALSGAAALPALVATPRALERSAGVAAAGAAVLGLPLVGYTGVLLANTAVPVWQATRNTLPVLFAFSGAVSAGGLFDLWRTPGPGGEMAHRFGLVAKGAELALSRALHREAGAVPRVERALRRGRGGLLLRTARGLLVASAIVDLLPERAWRRRHAASGALALLGTLALRFGVVAAGRTSARDPHATFEMQRAGRGAAELARKEGARPRMPSPPGIDPTGKETAEHGAAP